MNTFIFYFVCILSVGYSTDYYDLLGISKDADNREIRKAFKKLALKLHPDKTQEKDENAHEKFIAINKAYEVLKDENTRKKYDLYGEEGLKEDFGKSWKGNYHSWNYYSESFGIYDDDPEIITLNRHDFVHSVLESSVLWFVNFYSPQCSHCHHLAPAWRELARELKDVIQIGAVNCEEDWMLCRQQNVHSYPSLILYPRRAKYSGSRDAASMIDYILQLLPDKVIKLRSDSFNEITSKNHVFSKPWLIFVCSDLKSCFDKNDLKKLSLILDNLINVAEVNSKYDPEICSKINCRLRVSYYKNLYSNRVNDESKELEFLGFEFSTFIKKVYELLEGPIELTEEAYNKIRDGKSTNETLNPWLIEFRKTKTRTLEIDTELKRLKANLPEPGVSIGFFDCEKYPLVCFSLYIKKFPTLILFKTGWGYEIFHGTITVHDVVQFTKEALLSRVETLTPKEFPSVIESGETWFIDYFAPWCPPCMELLPLFRKISHSTNHIVKFGSVDCATHVTLCRQYNINSYPTIILYNQSVPHRYSGSHMEQPIRDFVEYILNPSVVSLTPSSFTSLVQNKEKGIIWIVDFFAPWCGPCQQMAPHWRKLAKMLHGISYLKVGAVDCEAHYSLCNSMGIRSYPTIHLYPMDSAGISRIFTYTGRNRDAVSLQGWVYDFLPSKVESLTSSSYKNVLSDKNPWIIDFFAPWCSHCQTFAPEFEKIAEAVEGKVKTGKINCDRFPDSCRLAGVRAYPTVLFYEGNEGHATQNPIGMEVETLTFKGVYSFLEQRLGLNAFKKETPRDEL